MTAPVRQCAGLVPPLGKTESPRRPGRSEETPDDSDSAALLEGLIVR